MSRAVLLLLGLSGKSDDSVALALGLREHGFHVSTLPIDGLRDRPCPPFERWISDSLAEVDRLASAHVEISICGISHGAALALAVAAERRTRLNCLALIAPALGLAAGAMSRWRTFVPVPEWLPDWRMRFRHQSRVSRVKQERNADRPVHNDEQLSLLSVSSVVSSAQLRETHRLVRYVRDSLGRVCTPTLIVHTGDAITAADVRYVQVHIGSQFLEVFLGSDNHTIPHGGVSGITVYKTVEFFNDFARRRTLAAVARS
jgi:esterase/lipase